MKILISGNSYKDLKNGYLFYEKQKEGLGSYFYETLLSDIESLHIFAGIHQVHYNKYYKMLSKRFPFAIYYKITNDTISNYAVVDMRRDPAWVRKKL